ncbi:RNA helicase [uncultured Dialister sp.]|uniref:RNA helicase n=1 Tax=uncultured Dialister sp. TaxID=278064 RepID=UPI0025DF4FBD|nr:RNA helicase [uncultured Dialister sp.]
MFSKFQDFLLVVVLFYAIYRIGFGEGVTMVNLFILLCAVVAVISMALKRSGAYDRAHREKEEAMKKKNEKDQ